MDLVVVRYDDPVVRALTAEVQAEYARLYGGAGDVSPIDAGEFAAPRGRFVLASVDGTPVGMGGWRFGGPVAGDAEIKRMFVRAAHRRSGCARRILDELERSAASVGVLRLVLETGLAQPAAIAMYRAAGFVDVPAFGHYADALEAVHLGKVLQAPPHGDVHPNLGGRRRR